MTFVYINGKPFFYNLASVFKSLFVERRFVWQKIERLTYKEVPILETEEITVEAKKPEIKPRETYIKKPEVVSITEEEKPEIKPEEVYIKKPEVVGNNLIIEVDYKEIVPEVKERVTLSLEEPILNQAESISKIFHRHLANPKNPYRFFPYIPYIKFYRALKK